MLGALIGEGLRIEDGLARFGAWLETRFAGGSGEATSTFVRGFLTASILFCVGPITILGSIQDGLSGDYQLLAIKSVLDGFAALALASALGVGVLFSIVVILVYQGGLTLLAAQAQAVLSEPMTAEMTAVGGILLARNRHRVAAPTSTHSNRESPPGALHHASACCARSLDRSFVPLEFSLADRHQ